MVRNDVEAILFRLPRWKEMPSAEEILALVVRDVSLADAEEIHKGGQFSIGQSGLDAAGLFDFFRSIDNGERCYYVDGYLKHPQFQKQCSMFIGTEVNGLRLTEEELNQFSQLFGESVEKLKNDDKYFFASWGSVGWSRFLYEAN